VIAAYLEGEEDGNKFVRALPEARARGKPAVMINAGATAASARAARAHTGSLVGEDRVFDAVLRGLGVIRVGSVEEMVDVCLMLAGTPLAKGMSPDNRIIRLAASGRRCSSTHRVRKRV
jgi:acetate---CoA ligase (ADP-forming)